MASGLSVTEGACCHFHCCPSFSAPGSGCPALQLLLSIPVLVVSHCQQLPTILWGGGLRMGECVYLCKELSARTCVCVSIYCEHIHTYTYMGVSSSICAYTCFPCVHTRCVCIHKWVHGPMFTLESLRECLQRAVHMSESQFFIGVYVSAPACFCVQECGQVCLGVLHMNVLVWEQVCKPFAQRCMP